MKKQIAIVALVAAAVMLGSFAALANTCNITDYPSSGTLTRAMLNGRLAQIESCINGGIDHGNLDSDTSIPVGYIANDTALAPVSIQLACGTKTSAFSLQLPKAGTLTDAFARCRDCSAADHDIDIQVNGTTRISFTGISDSTMQSDTDNTYSVSTGHDVEVDTTQTTAGSCSAYDVTLWFEIQHDS